MISDFKYMIYLFSCGARGEKAEINNQVNIENVARMSLSQSVDTIVYSAIENSEVRSMLPSELYSAWKQRTMSRAIYNERKHSVIHNALNAINEAGIDYCMLKGEIIADLYNEPILRVSADTDIYFAPENEKKVIKVLEGLEFIVKKREKNKNHFSAKHPVSGEIEGHVAMFSKSMTKMWFNDIHFDDFVDVTLKNGFKTKTLGTTENAVYFSMHLIKHFLGNGTGIRQVMDTLLFLAKYKNEIDYDKYKSILENMHYYKFMENIIGLGIEYLGFDKEDFAEVKYDRETVDEILNDIMLGGVFGYDENRAGIASIYSKKRYERARSDDGKDASDYHRVAKKYDRRSWTYILFSNKRDLQVNYPYVKKSPLLYPVAELNRVWDFVISVIKKDKNIKSYISADAPFEKGEVVSRRMDLIKKLDMI